MKGIASKATLVLAGVITSLIIAELALRLIGFSYPAMNSVDPDLGPVNRPHAEGWFSDEGAAHFQFNGEGYRDRDHSPDKPAGTFRIAVLGDSYVEALQVDVQETFWSLMEGQLDASCTKQGVEDFEVLAFGVSGYGTDQELLTLRHRVWRYAPDLVILAFLTGNDVRNNLRELEKTPLKPYFVLRNGELVLDTSFRDSSEFQVRQTWYWKTLQLLSDHVRLLQLLNRAKRVLRLRQETQQWSGGGEAGLDETVYSPPTSGVWERAWNTTEAILATMHREVAERGVRFLVVTLTNGAQVYPDPQVRARRLAERNLVDFSYADQRIARLGESEGFDVLVLAPFLRQYADRTGTFLHGFPDTGLGHGHWNEAGHRIAGERIADFVCRRFIEGGSSSALE